MMFYELILTSIGLSMDACAVSICKGIKMTKRNYKQMFIISLFFGIFQAGMSLIGYIIGNQFEQYILVYDHWIALGLLSFIGIKMIVESKDKLYENKCSSVFSLKEILILAVATSIDALAVGITFSFLYINIWLAIICIGSITFLFSFFGSNIGYKFGEKYKSRAELAGGIILILIGLKILIDHLILV